MFVIYPSFSEQNFNDIIDLSLNAYKKEAFELSGYELSFDDKGNVRHTAILHDLYANSITSADLGKVKKYEP